MQCPSDVIDQIGGWQTYGIGNDYGEGHTLKNYSGYKRYDLNSGCFILS